jgi:hypothetical protein
MDFSAAIIQNLTRTQPRQGSAKGVAMTDSTAETRDGDQDAAAILDEPLRLEEDDLLDDLPTLSVTPVSHIALELVEREGPYTPSRAEAIVELIVKSDRVFLDGACWRCTERLPQPGHDLGLCEPCLVELRS